MHEGSLLHKKGHFFTNLFFHEDTFARRVIILQEKNETNKEKYLKKPEKKINKRRKNKLPSEGKV